MSFHNTEFPLASAMWIFKGMFLSSLAVLLLLRLSFSLSIYAAATVLLAVWKTIFHELINLYWKTPHMLLFLFMDVESESQN